MGIPDGTYDPVLNLTVEHAKRWLDAVADRPIPPSVDVSAVAEALGGPLQDDPLDPSLVIDELVDGVEPGLMAMGSGRFFGWVIGGALPAALAADWLVTAWDQNAGMRFATPGVVAAEEVAAQWLLELLDLPRASAVGFVTGATMANWTGLAAGRHRVLADAGWDVERDGLTGAPRVNCFVGDEGHTSVDLALRYLGLGVPTRVAADEEGRVRPEALAAALDAVEGPTIVGLQAGNLHSGNFDPFAECVEVAHAKGAWVHVDGAFGLWAAATPRLRPLVAGLASADSWSTDAHKTLNVPYDSGIAIVSDEEALTAALATRTSYLVASEVGDPYDRTPEFSRRARGVPVWAALRSLGRNGVVQLVDGLVDHAVALADGIRAIPGAEVLNDVVYTQVSVSFGSDERTRAVIERLLADGTTWMSGSTWRGRAIMRISSSNWSTDAHDVARSIDAVARAVRAVDA
jgi:glutamate/tyrosine decarboxylase-like PLP-dependent enzyme